jgi:hypothetical protein
VLSDIAAGLPQHRCAQDGGDSTSGPLARRWMEERAAT